MTDIINLWLIETNEDHSEIVRRKAEEASEHFRLKIVVSVFETITELWIAFQAAGPTSRPQIILCDIRELGDHDLPTSLYNKLREIGEEKLLSYFSIHVARERIPFEKEKRVRCFDKANLATSGNIFFRIVLTHYNLIAK